MNAAIDALGDKWMHRFCVHLRAARSTTLRPVDIWRQMRKWLGLPKAERKRLSTGRREYTWRIAAGSYQTLARNARRLAVRQIVRQWRTEVEAIPF